jgi:hypothetical protein
VKIGEVIAIRVLSICSGWSCGGAVLTGFGGENRNKWIVSRAGRMTSARCDAYKTKSVLGEARTHLRELYAAMSEGDEGYWDVRKRDQSVCA